MVTGTMVGDYKYGKPRNICPRPRRVVPRPNRFFLGTKYIINIRRNFEVHKTVSD